MRGREGRRAEQSHPDPGGHARDRGRGAEGDQGRSDRLPPLLTAAMTAAEAVAAYPPRMAPAVPFALLGVVQLLAVAGWIGLAGASAFPRLRRRITPVFVVGALAMAAADATTALQLGTRESTGLAWLRLGGLLLLALGAAGGA